MKTMKQYLDEFAKADCYGYSDFEDMAISLINNGESELLTKRINEQAELCANQSKWVKVEDELPKITMKTSSDWVITFDKVRCRIDKAFYSKVTGWQAEHGDDMSVTHWMPLPAPPFELPTPPQP